MQCCILYIQLLHMNMILNVICMATTQKFTEFMTLQKPECLFLCTKRSLSFFHLNIHIIQQRLPEVVLQLFKSREKYLQFECLNEILEAYLKVIFF